MGLLAATGDGVYRAEDVPVEDVEQVLDSGDLPVSARSPPSMTRTQRRQQGCIGRETTDER